MILSTFSRLEPYRLHFFTAFMLSSAVFTWRMQQIPVHIVDGALAPDAAITGYSPQQALNWYDAIGDQGRSVYFQMFLIDLFVVMPSYVLMLGAQLVATGCPGVLCYFVVAIACFDLIESLTTGCAVIGEWRPSEVHLLVASAATQFKFVGIGLTLFLVAVYSALSYYRPVGKEKDS
jgi:hypothetical protein